MSLLTTSSQTVGPYVHIGFHTLATDSLAPDGVPGERITVSGRVTDGAGAQVTDAYLEIWQADTSGRYHHPETPAAAERASAFTGFGRIATDPEGRFRFTSIKPGPVAAPGGRMQAPHLNVLVFSRGLLKHLNTRMYFPDDSVQAEDPVLALVPAERRSTLVARRLTSGEYEWNLVLKGDGETVFFDY